MDKHPWLYLLNVFFKTFIIINIYFRGVLLSIIIFLNFYICMSIYYIKFYVKEGFELYF